MIVVQNTFRLKFGKAKEAVALWKEGMEIMKKIGMANSRVMTDLTGPSYTLVFENTFESLGEFESRAKSVMGADEWQKWYQKFIPLCEAGHREIFTVVQ
jgi:ABC-type uncharacterized transport system permease subunit